jgi:hypothetical protein
VHQLPRASWRSCRAAYGGRRIDLLEQPDGHVMFLELPRDEGQLAQELLVDIAIAHAAAS